MLECDLWEINYPWGWYSLGNISLDKVSHRLHGFSQIFCCLSNSYLQMSGCVVHMKLISVGLITDPLYLPLKWGGLVCPPLERAMIWRTGLSASWKDYDMEDKLACLVKGRWSAWNKSVQICGICGRLIYLWKIIIRGRQKLSSVGEKIIIRGED